MSLLSIALAAAAAGDGDGEFEGTTVIGPVGGFSPGLALGEAPILSPFSFLQPGVSRVTPRTSAKPGIESLRRTSELLNPPLSMVAYPRQVVENSKPSAGA